MRSKKIITVSEFTKKDILGIFKIDSNKIAVTLEGVASSINSGHNIDDDKKVILSYNIHKPYLLYVGNAYPHKNLEVLISILPKIREEKPDIQLVFVGKDDFFYQQLKKLARTKGLLSENNGRKLALIFAGFVPDKDLDVFYREAELYVFPSLYEGFGLPPLEAMSKGLPVVSSDKSCLPEILGDAALYFDATDEKDIIDKILFILKDDKLRKNYSELGRQQAKKYSWPSCVERTLAVFNKEILNE